MSAQEPQTPLIPRRCETDSERYSDNLGNLVTAQRFPSGGLEKQREIIPQVDNINSRSERALDMGWKEGSDTRFYRLEGSRLRVRPAHSSRIWKIDGPDFPS